MLNKINAKTKCDVRGCKNNAEFQFDTKGRNGKCFLCAECVANLCADGRARLVHKSLQNTIKKHIDKKLKEMDIAD